MTLENTNGIYVTVTFAGEGSQDENGWFHTAALLEHTPGLTNRQVYMILLRAADALAREFGVDTDA